MRARDRGLQRLGQVRDQRDGNLTEHPPEGEENLGKSQDAPRGAVTSFTEEERGNYERGVKGGQRGSRPGGSVSLRARR